MFPVFPFPSPPHPPVRQGASLQLFIRSYSLSLAAATNRKTAFPHCRSTATLRVLRLSDSVKRASIRAMRKEVTYMLVPLLYCIRCASSGLTALCLSNLTFQRFSSLLLNHLNKKSRQSLAYNQFRRNCISSTNSVVYHHCDVIIHLRLMIYTYGDDMPLLSQ